jgi:hypothetical protein
VSGTLVSASGPNLVVQDANGVRHVIHVPPGVRPTLAQRPAPAAAIFPGVRIDAHGTLSGSTLQATSITVSVRARALSGKVVQVAGRWMIVQSSRSPTAIRVDLPAGVTVIDGHKPASPAVGAYVKVIGYEAVPGTVRATSVRITHPSVSLSGQAALTGSTISLVTTDGSTYRLHFSSGTTVSTGREGLTIDPAAIPAGADLHVTGTVRADGSIAVQQVSVRLHSQTIRGSVQTIDAGSLTVKTATAATLVQIGPTTTIAQGSNPLAVTEVVVGDDVTVYGYVTGVGLVARKILVHRRLVGMDGTVSSLTSTGFVLAAIDGTSHSVVLSPTTVFTGLTPSTVAVGLTVHVTGYLRGDGVVLATRVRTKGRKPLRRLARL